jgi:hypothetical protein
VPIREPSLKVGQGRDELARKLVELIRAVNALEAGGLTADLTAIQAEVDQLQLDVAALEDAAGDAVTAGSIFSMTGPAGASAPIVVYDFTQFDDALTAAQNLTAANQSGVAALDLTAAGSAVHQRQTWTGSTGQAPFALTPIAASVEGGGLTSGSGTDYAETSGSPAALRLQAALTVEWLGYVGEVPGAGVDMQFFNYTAGGGETQAENSQYCVFFNGTTGSLTYFHESGAGVDGTVGFFLTTAADFAVPLGVPLHLCLTRSAAGLVNLYINGRMAGPAGTAASSALPDGGTSANLRIGQGGGQLVTSAVRIFDVALTPAQARASYHRTMYGVAA